MSPVSRSPVLKNQALGGEYGAGNKGDTTLNAAVFAQQDEFKAVAQTFEAGAAKLVSVSERGDLSAIKAQFGEVAKSCKGCHEKFRTR